MDPILEATGAIFKDESVLNIRWGLENRPALLDGL